ncbi:ABC transporter permease [Haloferax sp. Atlit-47N]|uniref:ABC transporter permease n=1 Tax=Haloferax sp. Atlit-48N TaxID=2077198 RepID=A0ACD5I172_9EURY|nr:MULTISPECIES: ABC transporter permease [unclassified Haloferax]RDZ30688.1 ABC transporter permease [Haloferax sp. Atlit-48N]RDZ35950.1 ABC transporter permease [Haloferax sp. Atlit-47N]
MSATEAGGTDETSPAAETKQTGDGGRSRALAGATRRVRAEAVAETRAFLRRRTAVFFTFFFPVFIVLIFGVLVKTGATGGLFSRSDTYYLPAYLGVVVVLTPLSRVGSTVARNRASRRFEKLATTPLSRLEWLSAHAAVNIALIGLAGVLLVGVLAAVGDLGAAPSLGGDALVVAFLVVGIALFCGLGSLVGSLADSEDGVIAASNAVGIPMVLLADTFVPASRLPAALRPVIDALPLTYFARGVRAAVAGGELLTAVFDLAVLCGFTVALFALSARLLPWRE